MKWRAFRWVAALSTVGGVLLVLPAHASTDQITLYTPVFEGSSTLGASVATILNLQIFMTLRRAPSPNPQGLSFGDSAVVWGRRPLERYSHEDAEARAKEVSLLAQLVFWGKVYSYGEGAIAQTNLSMPAYHDFRDTHPERWTINIHGPSGIVRFATDLPQRRYSFEPIVLSGKVIKRYSQPGALLIYERAGSQKVVGAIGKEFSALEHAEGMVKVASGVKKGWVRLPELSTSRSEVVDFVGGIIRVFRGDWVGAESLMDRVIANKLAPNEIRTDAYLYKGWAAAQQDQPSEAAFLEARKLSPYAKRCIVYAVMGKLSDYRRIHASSGSARLRKGLLRDAWRLLDEHHYLFEPGDPWVDQVAKGLSKLGEPIATRE